MDRRLPPMAALRSFEAAAQLLSFKEAAARLHRTPSAVSHQIRGLEDELGTRLFHREPHGLRLTDAGQAYLAAVRSALDDLAEATTRMRRAHGQAGLTLSIFPSLAVRWLIPRLGDFRTAHPEIELEIVSSVRQADFESGTIDAAVRFGAGDWSGLRCDPLMVEQRLAVCSPRLVAPTGALRDIGDLADAVLLHNGAHPGEWATWLSDAGHGDIPAEHGPVLDASNEVLEAAANGLGVALGRTPLVDPDLAAGRLVDPFDLRLPSRGRYWLVAPQATADEPSLVALREWLQRQAHVVDADRAPT